MAITRRQFVKQTTAVSTIETALAGGARASNAKANVLFIAVDDLNDYVSLLDNFPGVKTPNLDRFSQTALTFRNAHCAGPICNPSRTSVLTGVAPHRSGVYDNNDHWTMSTPVREATAIPERFKSDGYTTLLAGRIFHEWSTPYKDRLLAMWDDLGEEGVGPWSGSTRETSWGPWSPEEYEGSEEDFADVRNRQITIERLRRNYEKPFFMAHGIIRPHRPWSAPKRFFDQYPLEAVQLPPFQENDLADVPIWGRFIAQDTGLDFPKARESGEWRKLVRAYLASISFADQTLGLVLDALDESPFRDNTIVCVWADHGFHMGEKEHLGKWTLWEQATRNLLMMRVPGVTQGRTTCDRPVSLLDIYPTLIDLCGLGPVPQQMAGRSLRPLLEDPKAERTQPVVTTYLKGNHAVRSDRWRYIRYRDGSEELYDHSNDSNEFRNLAQDPNYGTVKRRLAVWLPSENTDPVGPHPGWWVHVSNRKRQRAIEELKGRKGRNAGVDPSP